MANHSIRVSRETDLLLDNAKLQIKEKYHKKVYKGRILDLCVRHCLSSKGIAERFLERIKKDC